MPLPARRLTDRGQSGGTVCRPAGRGELGVSPMTRHLTIAALFVLGLTACKDEPGGGDGGPPLPFISDPARADAGCDWTQWGQNWAHTGQSCVAAQGFGTVLGTVTFDPFVPQE